MQVTARSFLLVLTILTVVLFSTGVLSWQKSGYGCYPDHTNRFRWGEKTELFRAGSFHIYGYPLIKDCPEENRYDPAQADDCGTYCTRMTGED